MKIIILGIGIILIMGTFIYIKWKHDKEFERWFDEVLRLAPFFGFTQEKIDEFEELEFWNYFLDELSEEEALKQFLADN